MNVGIHGLKLPVVKELVYSTDSTKVNQHLVHFFKYVMVSSKPCDELRKPV
jgi:hypothetical protein